MIYPLLLLAFGLGAMVTLRNQPLNVYVRIFFASFLLTVLAESVMLRIFRIFEWRMWLFPDPRVDKVVATMFIAVLDPLQAVLFARFCRPRPVVTAIIAAMALGALEWWLVAEGYLLYHRFWHPLLTAAMFFAYFLVIWRAAISSFRLPLWVDTHGVALWAGMMSDAFLGVVLGLWEYQAAWTNDPWQDGRLLMICLHGLIFCPLATAAAAAQLRNRWMWAAGAAVVVLVVEGVAWTYGLLVYTGWSVGLSFIRWSAVVAVTVVYAAWIRLHSLEF